MKRKCDCEDDGWVPDNGCGSGWLVAICLLAAVALSLTGHDHAAGTFLLIGAFIWFLA